MMRKRFSYDYPRPMVAADVTLFSVAGGKLRTLFIQRKKKPWPGRWAFPGGFVELDEDLPDAAARELEEETGLKKVSLEFLNTYGKPGRDPRGRVISHVYFGIVPYDKADVRAGDDAADALWHPAYKPPLLAFDHNEILKDALEFLKGRVLDGDGAFRFLPPKFAPDELRGVFESVLKKRITKGKFEGEMKRLGLLKGAEGKRKRLCKKTLTKRLKELGLIRL
ncbi:MAG: NUDIX domain-containing protein [Planctomycetota bacterium]|jgi:8-oxo-dGTP diphosphatase